MGRQAIKVPDKTVFIETVMDMVAPTFEDASKGKTKAMTIRAACNKLGVSHTYFYELLERYPSLKKRYEDGKIARKKYAADKSREILQKAIDWEMEWLSPKDRLDAAKWFLSNTDVDFQNRLLVDKRETSMNLNINVMQDQLKNLLFNNKNATISTESEQDWSWECEENS